MWYINQKIICVKTHSERKVIKDCIYTIRGFDECKCGLGFDVGLKTRSLFGSLCSGCGSINRGDTYWIDSSLFAPLLADSIEYAEKLLEEITIELNEEILITK